MVNISWQVDAFPSWRADCPDREGRTPEPSSRVTHVDAAATASGLVKQQRETTKDIQAINERPSAVRAF